MIIIGIDPGMTGGIAVLRNRHMTVHGIGGSLVDAIELLRNTADDARESRETICAVLEKVNAMPRRGKDGESHGMGATTLFTFASGYGHLRGALLALGIPIAAEPVPRTWKKRIFGGRHDGLSRAEQKKLAREEARTLYPCLNDSLRLVKDADKAEAALLAHYGWLLAGTR